MKSVKYDDFFKVYNSAKHFGMIVLTKDIKLAQSRFFLESTLDSHKSNHLIGFSKHRLKDLNVSVGDDIQIKHSDIVLSAKIIEQDNCIPEKNRNGEYNQRYGNSIIQISGDLRNSLNLSSLLSQPVFSYNYNDHLFEIKELIQTKKD